MALAKALQKMAATNHQAEEAASPSASVAADQDAGSAGILLSLLTEPPQPKTSPRPGQPTVATTKSSSPPPPQTESNTEAEKKDASSKPSPENSASRSVLLQLLQERKVVFGPNQGPTQQPTESPVQPENVNLEPIVITPANGHKGHGEDDNSAVEAKTNIKKEVTSSVCQICQCGFWDPEKYIEHMKSEHGQIIPEDSLNSNKATGPEAMTDSSVRSSSVKSNKTPPPAATLDNEDKNLRRSKRKRTPARMKYYNEELPEPSSEDLEELQPKILCVEGNVSGSESSHSRQAEDARSISRKSDDGSMSEAEWKSKSKMTASNISERSLRSDEESVDVDRPVSSENVIDELMTFRCLQCYLYFNSREETRIHLRKEHNILTPSNPPRPTAPIPQSTTPVQSTTSTCSSCGGQGDSQKTSPSKRCVICGKTETPGVKSFINIFRARTWSSRHHQLARRLSEAFGCKFSLATCKSKSICLGCVQKLENVEKASMQLRQMVKNLKRTDLVTSIGEMKMKGSKKRMAKTAASSAASSSRAEEPEKTEHPVETANIPSAPLVRELLAAPEVLLPQSQFSELLGALGNHKGPSEHASFSIAQLPQSSFRQEQRGTSSSGSSRQKHTERRNQKQSRNVATVQHNDAAFNDFVKELRSQQASNSASRSSGSQPAPEGLGRILAEVRVKQEPSDQSDEHLASSNQQSQAEALGVISEYDNSADLEAVHHVLEDLSSLYTTMQIDSRSGQTEYTCTLCNNSFYSEAAIQLHVKCHLPGSKDLQCFLCGYHNNLLPSQWRIIKRHLETEHEFPETYFHRFPCPVRGCAELFKCHRDMVVHVSKVHRTPARLAREHALADIGLFNFPCPHCGTLLNSEAALKVHMLCHNNSPKHYQCCYCGYMHTSQPGSWRIMRGHLTKEHVDKELASDIFSYHECPYYACRLKFCSKKAQIVHRACHDETKDGEFFCFQCHYSVPSTPYLWEKVRDHIIAKHPEAVADNFRCTCKARFDSFRGFLHHLNQMQLGSARH